MSKLPRPRRLSLGRFRGKTYSRYTVRVSQSGLHRDLWEKSATIEIIAASPVEAVNAVKDELVPHLEHPTEFDCAGPKGGITHRFLGWETLIGEKMFAPRPRDTQLLFIYDFPAQ